MDLSQQLAILRPRLRLIVIVTLIAGVLSFALASFIPRTYEASATLLVGQVYDSTQASQPPQLSYDAFLASEQLATTFAALADTRPVLAKVAATLSLTDDPSSLRGRVDALAPPGSLFITISARAASDTDAANLANAVANELIAESPGILVSTSATKVAGVVTLVDPAQASEAVKSPKVTLYAALGGLTALIVSITTIFILAYRESPQLRRTPAARRVGTPELAPIPEPANGARPTAPADPRPVVASQGPPAPPEPTAGPMLLTEVRRPALPTRPATPVQSSASVRPTPVAVAPAPAAAAPVQASVPIIIPAPIIIPPPAPVASPPATTSEPPAPVRGRPAAAASSPPAVVAQRTRPAAPVAAPPAPSGRPRARPPGATAASRPVGVPTVTPAPVPRPAPRKVAAPSGPVNSRPVAATPVTSKVVPAKPAKLARPARSVPAASKPAAVHAPAANPPVAKARGRRSSGD